MIEWIDVNKKLPAPQCLDDEENDYYLIKVDGYVGVQEAMYCYDSDGKCGWYPSYTSKIIREVVAWTDID